MSKQAKKRPKPVQKRVRVSLTPLPVKPKPIDALVLYNTSNGSFILSNYTMDLNDKEFEADRGPHIDIVRVRIVPVVAKAKRRKGAK